MKISKSPDQAERLRAKEILRQIELLTGTLANDDHNRLAKMHASLLEFVHDLMKQATSRVSVQEIVGEDFHCPNCGEEIETDEDD